uniref:DNA-directed RNA polymerase n=1 Tax=Candida corydali TaxID=391826 RepID=S5U590_9ASCO|nr:hypothetical protein [Candida corydali]AGS44543.1 hypothetical protein [Candida corydali]
MVKKCVMIIPYNASRRTFSDEIVNTMVKKGKLYYKDDDSKVGLTRGQITIIAGLIMDILLLDFPNLQEFILYTKAISKLCSELDFPVVWEVPNGISVHQYYRESKSVKIKKSLYSNNTITLTNLINEIDERKQKIALMPNFIHSLDAGVLAILVNNLWDTPGFNHKINTIHDCFTTTLVDMKDLKSILVNTYTKMYLDDTFLIGSIEQF